MKTKPIKLKLPKTLNTKAEQQKKLEDALIVLDEVVKVRVAPSSIHGVGVFAMRDIKRGEKLYTDAVPHAFDVPYKMFKKLRPDVAETILGRWPQIVNGSHFFWPDTQMAAFLNHSDNPNYDAKNDKTLKKIRAGEEITEDYRLIENYTKVFSWLK